MKHGLKQEIKRGLSIIMAASMVAGSTMPVFAEDVIEETIEVAVEEAAAEVVDIVGEEAEEEVVIDVAEEAVVEDVAEGGLLDGITLNPTAHAESSISVIESIDKVEIVDCDEDTQLEHTT